MTFVRHPLPAGAGPLFSGSQKLLRSVLATAISLSLLAPSTPAQAVTINVSGACTLVDAIASANGGSAEGSCSTGSAGADILQLVPSSMHTLVAVNNNDKGDNALPSISSVITIEGNGATIQPSVAMRLLYVNSGGTLILNNVTLSNGMASSGAYRGDVGGAILNKGILELNGATIAGNSATGDGGGIANFPGSTATINNSMISNNVGIDSGGGLTNISSTVTLNRSTVADNRTTSGLGSGGGLFSQGSTVTISQSTVSGNTTPNRGGGIYSAATSIVTLSNSTVSDNHSVVSGGGLYQSSSTITITNSTISNNETTGTGGGLFSSLGLTVANNTIIANNQGTNGAEDCFQSPALGTVFNVGGINWFEKAGCGRAAQGDPKLGPLKSNGGPTQTHALSYDSPLIDLGSNAFCGFSPVSGIDQRGVVRPQDACDIGAYEYEDTNFFVIPVPSGKAVIFGL